MEIKNVFLSIGIVLIGLVGIIGLIGDWNNTYGTSVGVGFNNTLTHIQNMTNSSLSSIGGNIAENTREQEGSGEEAQTSMIKRAYRTIQEIPNLLGLVPAIMRDVASIAGAPQWIVVIASLLFFIILGLTLTYLFIIGARRLV